MKAADGAALKLGVSRSGLFSIALEKFLSDRRNEEMMEELNRLYACRFTPDRRIVAAFNRSRIATSAMCAMTSNVALRETLLFGRI